MGRKILVAEDSDSIRKFIVFALKLAGFEVVQAVDGMEAMEKMVTPGIELLITDLNMPNMDGFTLIKTLRDSDEFKLLPIIILSSLSKDADVSSGLAFGANSYLIKPFNQKKLMYEIAKYIDVKLN